MEHAMILYESLKFPLPKPSSGKLVYWTNQMQGHSCLCALAYLHVHSLLPSMCIACVVDATTQKLKTLFCYCL